MKKFPLLVLILFCMLVTGCSVINEVAPPPPDAQVPTESESEPINTPLPTLGEPEFIDAAYCWESHIDEAEYNLVRFFPSGLLIDVFVQPYSDCADAWANTKEYLFEESLMNFNHGEYHLSGDQIRYTLSPPNSEEVSGEIIGTYTINTMLLKRVGSEEREYILISSGE